jgi:hypothetical protein
MFNGDLNVGNYKKIITLEQTKELIKHHYCYGRTWVDFIHSPKNKLTKDTCNCFLNQFHELLKVVHKLILVKLHIGTRVWMLKKGSITIYIEELTKHRKWFPFYVCLLKFIKIISIVIILNHYVPQDGYWLLGFNINKFLLKLMPCDWVCYWDELKKYYGYLIFVEIKFIIHLLNIWKMNYQRLTLKT